MQKLVAQSMRIAGLSALLVTSLGSVSLSADQANFSVSGQNIKLLAKGKYRELKLEVASNAGNAPDAVLASILSAPSSGEAYSLTMTDETTRTSLSVTTDGKTSKTVQLLSTSSRANLGSWTITSQTSPYEVHRISDSIMRTMRLTTNGVKSQRAFSAGKDAIRRN